MKIIKKFAAFLGRLRKSEDGAGLIEFLLVIVIALVLAAAVAAFVLNVVAPDLISKITSAMNNFFNSL